jgi:hypothetical protein
MLPEAFGTLTLLQARPNRGPDFSIPSPRKPFLDRGFNLVVQNTLPLFIYAHLGTNADPTDRI